MATEFRTTPTSRGYTLVEMLIVVAVLATVVGLSWPALSRPLAKSRLRNAARELRNALAGARLEAIESGVAQQFRYQLRSGCYDVTPTSAPDDTGAFTPVSSEGLLDDGTAAPDPFAYDQPDVIELSDGVMFMDPVALQGSDLPTEEALPADSLIEADWSDPIVFYPNGRTFNARFRLAGDKNYFVDVTLRGLTGVAKVGQIELVELPLEEEGDFQVEGDWQIEN